MTIEDIKTLVTSVDPAARHYTSMSSARSYTVWYEIRRIDLMSDGEHHDEAWSFQVDRFCKDPDDLIAQQLFNALDADPRVAFAYLVDHEPDTGYIHHIYDCEGC